MFKLLFVFLFYFLVAAEANVKFEIVAFKTIEPKFKVSSQLVGGLSAALKISENEIVFISDDRGEHGKPRWFKAHIELNSKNELEISNWQAQIIDFSKSATEKKVKNSLKKVDLEGVAILPWGNFLMSSEGDYNFFPRISPSFIEVKPNGEFVKEYLPPSDYIPNKNAKLIKGIKNNLGFEGLCFSKENNFWIAATESFLKQEEKSGFLRFLQIKSESAWNLSFGQEWKYPISVDQSYRKGVSEIFCHDKNKIWVLERSVSFGGFSIQSDLQLYEVSLDAADQDKNLIKKRIWNLSDTFKQDPWKNSVLNTTVMNIEGIAEGPKLKDGTKTLILVTDNNFFKNLPTVILLVKMN